MTYYISLNLFNFLAWWLTPLIFLSSVSHNEAMHFPLSSIPQKNSTFSLSPSIDVSPILTLNPPLSVPPSTFFNFSVVSTSLYSLTMKFCLKYRLPFYFQCPNNQSPSILLTINLIYLVHALSTFTLPESLRGCMVNKSPIRSTYL